MEKKKKLTAKEFEQTVIELYDYQLKFRDIENTYKSVTEELQNKIKNYLRSKGETKINFQTNYGRFKGTNKPFRVNNVIRKKIDWDLELLKKNIGKDLYNKVVDKEYKIDDIEGLISYLKSCGVNPKVFKSFLNITEKVNQEVMDELGRTGEITIEDLAECYTVTENEGYIRITELEE